MAGRGEEREQARLIIWSHKQAVRERMPELRFLHHSPNGGKRDAFTGAQMKALGVRQGFPDLILPVSLTIGYRGVPCSGLAIEMKSEVGRLSESQQEWKAHLEANGWEWHLCRSAEDARAVICQYLGVGEGEVVGL